MFNWIVETISTGGYFGIFFLMVLENLFPPIPSEVIIPLAGYAAAEGKFNIFLVIVVAAFGAVVGAFPWYALARFFGIARLKHLSIRFGRIMTLSPSDIDAADAWFKRHGPLVVLFGRLAPTIRTLISVPAGIARMRLRTFFFYSMIGSLIWTTLLASLGFMLQSQHEKVAEYLDPVSNGIIGVIIGIYIYRVITFKPK